MEAKLIGAVKWLKANWAAIVQVVGAAYIVLDVVVRWVIPADKMDDWYGARNKIKAALSEIYFKLEQFFSHTR